LNSDIFNNKKSKTGSNVYFRQLRPI